MKTIIHGTRTPSEVYLGYDLNTMGDPTPYRTTSSSGRVPINYHEKKISISTLVATEENINVSS